jgi:general secretion pathway protein D
MMRVVLKPLATVGLLLALSVPAHAAKTWKVNLKDAEISALVTEVAEITGKNFVVDPRVKGSITVISSKALTAHEVYELFLGVLGVNGFAAVQNGNTIKLVPDINAKQFALRMDEKGTARGEELVTRVITLDNTSAVELVPVLRPMMPQFAIWQQYREPMRWWCLIAPTISTCWHQSSGSWMSRMAMKWKWCRSRKPVWMTC